MSATGRTEGQRIEHDVYETPSWCVHRLLEARPDGLESASQWLEPCAGGGAIVKAVNEWYGPAQPVWDVNELRPQSKFKLQRLKARNVTINDFRELHGHSKYFVYKVAITNPPYALAEEVIRHCLTLAPHVWMLLRVNFLGSEEREAFFGEWLMPDVYVLPNRPPFAVSKKTGKVGTDATEYAWMHWAADNSQPGIVRRLALTPNEVRKESRDQIQRLYDGDR